MNTRIMDQAARVLADPQAYADENRLHEALAHLRAHAPVSWVEVEGYKPFWAITKHADVMDIERQNDLFTNDPRPLLMIAEGEDVLRAQHGGRHRLAHADPHGRPAPPRHAQDRRRLVPAVGDAGLEGPRRRAGQDLRRQDGREGPGVRLRPGDRRQLPAVCDPVAAGPAGVGLPADAQAHPGDVRRQRHRVPARRHHRRHARGAAGLLQLLRRADRVASRTPDRRPGLGDRQRQDQWRAAVGHGHRVLLRDRGQRRVTTPPAPASPAACWRCWRTPTSWPGCRRT